MINTLVILGAGGDLTARSLLPAVASLLAAGRLGPDFRVLGAGPQDWTDEDFAEHVRDRVSAHARHVDGAARNELVGALSWRRADVTAANEVAGVIAGDEPVVVYLALPTQVMLAALRALAARGLPTGSRVAVEKPFGFDAASAGELNAVLAGLGAGVGYRVDHVLAMTGVQQLQVDCDIRDTRDVGRIELLFEETLALEGRASFYDRAGALRDVMQNHLVQILCSLIQDRQDAPAAAEHRAAVLRTVRPLSPADVVARTRRARYSAGRLAGTGGADGRAVPDYRAESGVDPQRDTETFAEVVLELDDPRWDGVEFVLRAGKALAARRRGVLIHFRTGSAPAADGPSWVDLDDERDPVPAEPLAYQRILADLLSGGNAFAVSATETELAWQVFTPVLQAWAANEVPLTSYPAGSAGP